MTEYQEEMVGLDVVSCTGAEVGQESIDLLALIEETVKKYGSNNKFKYAIAENFECHKYTRIEFSELLTVFVGMSSQGKSSFMRMLDWVMYNSIRGDEHISTGEKECRGTIATCNGFIVTREITPSRNRYYLTHESWDQDFILERFGVNVPYEIQVVLGAFKVKVDDKRQNDLKLNYLEQGQGWFLISDQYPSTVKAKAVGLLYGVHYLDQAINDTKYELDRVKKSIASTEKDIEGLKEELKKYEHLDDLKKRIGLIQKAYDKGVMLKTLAEKLVDLKEKYGVVCCEYNDTVALLSRINEDELNEAEAVVQDLGEKIEKLSRLSALAGEYKASVREVKACNEIIQRGSMPDTVDQLMREVKDGIQRLKTLAKLGEGYYETKEIIKIAEKQIAVEGDAKKAEKLLKSAVAGLEKGARLIPMAVELNDRLVKLKNCERMIEGGRNISLAEAKLKEATSDVDRFIKIKALVEPFKRVQDEINRAVNTLDKVKGISEAEKRFKRLYRRFEKGVRLIPLSDAYKDVIAQIRALEPHLEHEGSTKKMNALKKKVEELLVRHETLLRVRAEYKRTLESIQGESSTVEQKLKELDGMIEKYETIIQELGICPLCKSEITGDVIKHMVGELRK